MVISEKKGLTENFLLLTKHNRRMIQYQKELLKQTMQSASFHPDHFHLSPPARAIQVVAFFTVPA